MRFENLKLFLLVKILQHWVNCKVHLFTATNNLKKHKIYTHMYISPNPENQTQVKCLTDELPVCNKLVKRNSTATKLAASFCLK